MKSQAPKGPNIMSITPRRPRSKAFPLQCEANGYAGIFGSIKGHGCGVKESGDKTAHRREGCNSVLTSVRQRDRRPVMKRPYRNCRDSAGRGLVEPDQRRCRACIFRKGCDCGRHRLRVMKAVTEHPKQCG